MPTYIGLLRAVNVGGVTLKMERLRIVAEQLGWTSVRTVLQSGNLIFEAPSRPPLVLEQRLEKALSERAGLTSEVYVRTVPEWRSLIARNPFSREANDDPTRLTMTALKAAPPPRAWEALRHAVVGRERVEGEGRHAYIVFPDGQGRSKLTHSLIERTLATSGTTRNWNTVRRLEAIAAHD